MGVLVTQKVLKCASKCIIQGEILQAHPLTWDLESGKPQRVTSAARYKMWKLNSCIMISYYLYMNVRFLIAIFSKQTQLTDFVQMSLVSAFYSFIPMSQATMILNRDSFHIYFRKVLTAFGLFEDLCYSSLKTTPSTMKLCELFVQAILLEFPFNGIMFGSMAVWNCESIESVLPAIRFLADFFSEDSIERGWALLFLSAVFHFYVMLNLIPVCSMIGVLGCEAIFMGITAMQELRRFETLQLKNPSAASLSLMEFRERIRMYRIISLVFADFSHIFSIAIWGTEAICLFMALLGAYCTIRAGGFLTAVALPVGAGLLTFILCVFNFLAELDLRSLQLLQAWELKAHKLPADFKRTIECLRPLRVRLGSMFYIDKLLVLTVCKIVLDGVVNVLLTA